MKRGVRLLAAPLEARLDVTVDSENKFQTLPVEISKTIFMIKTRRMNL